ncbi:MAG: rod shape-determining protein MreD [Porticoccaceae bacterium]|jgi:rod shape-determining protein MreD|nr:rod shape-determining protein MreD [Porticoccaceae bacterium]MDG1495834.1 rod shape-determining protein MreD [Porticoccaceae bacterium]
MESDNRGVAIGLTLVLAVILSLMPLSGDWIVWKPNFLLLVVMAWVIHWPNDLGILFAASVGLLADIVLRMTLGHSVIAFALCAGAIVLLSRWSQYLSMLQRTLLVALIISSVAVLEASVFIFYDRPSGIEHLPLKILLSMLVWPFIDRLVARLQPKRG